MAVICRPRSSSPPAGVSSYSHGNATLFAAAWGGDLSAAPFPGTHHRPWYHHAAGACQGETMAEALVVLQTAAGRRPRAATPSVNVAFTDPWFGGGAGNEPLHISPMTTRPSRLPLPTPHALRR